MTLLVDLMVWLYFILSMLIGLFCLSQFVLFLYYFTREEKKNINNNPLIDQPHVTIQLPIYNEKYVAERIINAAIKIKYPKDRLEIQVLDDSTDDTQQIVSTLVNEYFSKGHKISHIHRTHREGYKAGALRHGMSLTSSEYFCIFDADFVPNPDFLITALPFFNGSNVGVVQTKWGHINENENLLTRFQAFQLNVHFSIEQGGRFHSGNFLQFNGTAGIWRRAAIEDAQGWQNDTLTEDLDLSYRSQLQGWKIVYCEQLLSPAELPSEIAGLKSQQFRWMKGGAQTAKKLLPTIWSSQISFTKKVWSSLHLFSSSVYVFIFLIGLLSYPMLILTESIALKSNPLIYLVSWVPFIFISSFYANVLNSSSCQSRIRRLLQFGYLFPHSLAMNIGFSLHNTVAVIEGWLGIKSGFKRTPKKGALPQIKYSTPISKLIYVEGFMVFYFVMALLYGLSSENYSFILFHILCIYGYLAIFLLSLNSKFHNHAIG